jgi:hypothetical protein
MDDEGGVRVARKGSSVVQQQQGRKGRVGMVRCLLILHVEEL